MEYTEVNIKLSEVNPFAEIVVARLNEIDFESYSEDENGVKAYVQSHLLKEDLVCEILNDISKTTELSFTISKVKQENWNKQWESNFDPVTIKDDSVKLVNKIDTAVSILINEPFKAIIKGTDSETPKRSQIILKYAAAPKKAKSTITDLKISEVYTEALLNYAAYKAHGAISGDMQSENNTYYMRYESSCKQLINSGMWGNNEIETNTKLVDNGFV